jgi:hypothetical protein
MVEADGVGVIVRQQRRIQRRDPRYRSPVPIYPANASTFNTASAHVHHAATHTADLPYPVIGWFLAVTFLLDAVVVVAAVVRPPGEAEPMRRDVVVTVFPHLAMDIAMTAMLVAA